MTSPSEILRRRIAAHERGYWRCCMSLPCVCGMNPDPALFKPTPKIEPGTVVRHVWTGIKMTVEGRDGDVIECVGFTSGQRVRASIPVADLEVVS